MSMATYATGYVPKNQTGRVTTAMKDRPCKILPEQFRVPTNTQVLSAVRVFYISRMPRSTSLIDPNGRAPGQEGYSHEGAVCKYLEDCTGFQWQHGIHSGMPSLVTEPFYRDGNFEYSRLVPVPGIKHLPNLTAKREQFLAYLRKTEKAAAEILLATTEVQLA